MASARTISKNPGDSYETMGWDSETAGQRHVMDTYAEGMLRAARIWSEGGSYTSVAEEGWVRGVLVVEGAMYASYDGAPIEVHTGEAILLDGEAEVIAENRAACARFYWQLPVRSFQDRSMRSMFGDSFQAAAPAWQALTSVSNALLNASSVSPVQGAHFTIALEHLLLGLAAERRAATKSSIGLHREHLLSEAMSLIDQHFHEQRFDSVELARRLRIHRSSLARLFETIGTTPFRVIQQRRVALARQLIQSSPPARASDAEHIAAAAGFHSRVHMWRTLRRQDRRESDGDEGLRVCSIDGAWGSGVRRVRR